MIFTESTIKISNNVSKMDSTIVLYRGDKNIEIRFTILQSPFKYSNTVATNVIESTNASYGQLVIKTPNDKPPIFSEVSATKEGTVLFTITKEMIDEIEELGTYTFQIRLMDENKQSRVTIPPVENGIEIKEPIAIEDDNTSNVVGLAKANYAVAISSDVDTPTFDDNGKYNKTNWNDGDIITNASLNKIEEGIYTTNENVTATKKYVDDNRIGYIKSETVGETIDTSTMINSFNNNSYIYESNNVTYLEIGKEYHVIVNGVRYRALCITNMPGNDQIYETIIVTGDGFSISIMNKMGYNTKYYTDNTKCAYEIKLSDELLAAPPTIQILKMDIEYIPTYLMPKDLEILNSISVNRIGDIGTGSAAIGYKNTASNDFTFAMGIQTTASASGAHAEGGLTVANASYSHAEGFKSASTGEYSHVEGIVCESSGQGSHAEGYYTIASGQRSHSEGCFTEAASQYQHVQGKYNVVDSKGVYAHIVGNGTGKNNRHNAHTLDWQGNAWFAGEVQGTNLPYTISSKVLVTVPASDIKIGDNITINNISINKDRRYYIEFLGTKKLCSLLVSEELGNCIICSIGGYTIQAFNHLTNIMLLIELGKNDITTVTFTDLIIYEEEIKYLDSKYLETDLTLQNSISLGRVGDIGSGSSAVGMGVTASGTCSHAEGYGTIASAKSSHAEGDSTEASGMNSHAEGSMTTSSGDYSHAEGDSTEASAKSSHAEGDSTEASGMNSHAEGEGTTASGMNSHAEGSATTASGDYSHAEGNSTAASGMFSHAEGSTTTASGVNSHAEGDYTTASGASSHAEGYGSKASSQFQHVQGKYNIEDKDRKYAHIVGNGAGDAKRSNAHTLDWQGNAWYSGKITTGAAPVEDMDLTTKKYVDDKVTSLPQLSFNEAGELVVTINGVSKTFVPKNV